MAKDQIVIALTDVSETHPGPCVFDSVCHKMITHYCLYQYKCYLDIQII